MPLYLATSIEAMTASFIRSPVISAGKVIVGKPSGRNFLIRAVLRIITCSSKAFRTVRAPESMMISLIPS